jgi:NAD(P)-dependent dehydrogenase (short-subunit alcohol dehydrogenase family)
MKRFIDRTILDTGAGSGIGAACVRGLFAEGASIAAADVRKEAVDEVVAEFASSDRIFGAGVDVSETFMGWSTAPASEGSATFWTPNPRFGGRCCRLISMAHSTCARLLPEP